MDAETLEKSAKAGLVQVERQVSKNGRTFTQHFWIKPGDVKPTDRVLTQQPNAQPKAPAQPQGQSNTKTAMVSLLSSHGRDALMAHAKANGVAWKENANEGINWMRASMAIQKHMASNPGVWDAAKIGASGNDKSGQQSTQPDDKKQQDAQPTQQDDSKPDKTPAKDDKTAPTPADKAAKTTPEAKKKVKELADNMGRDKLMETAKKNGITWNEHSNPAVNWMRASMAISAALTVDPDVMAADTVQADLKATQTRVKQLEDLVSQLQSPTAQQVATQQQQADVLKGITTDFMSGREKKEFGADLSRATPEQFMRARTLGMVAGDGDAADYLERLYEQYVETMNAPKSRPTYMDSLHNKLSGVVNQKVVSTVRSNLKNIRKKSKGATFQMKLLEPWVDPNTPLTADQLAYIKSFKSGMDAGQARMRLMTEADGYHGILKRCLDKMEQTQEYGALVPEYRKTLEEYETLTRGIPFVQTITGNPGYSPAKYKSGNGYLIALNDEVVRAGRNVDMAKNWYDDRVKYANEMKQTIADGETDLTSPYYINPSATKAEQDKRRKKNEEILANHQNAVAKAKQRLDAAEAYQTQLQDAQDYFSQHPDELIKAAQVRERLNNAKFTDLNVNLYHMRAMAAEIASQYHIQKDFVAEYPVLSKANIDLLETGDETALTNLALYAGMFKPSLSKQDGKSAQDVIMEKYQERQELIKAYGGIQTVQGASQYSENNEVKCRVSKASDADTKRITDNIARDWDKKNHGRMRYKIKGVYEVSGLALDAEFQKIKASHTGSTATPSAHTQPKRTDSDLFYHGTGAMATSLILGHSGEFRVVQAKVGRMLGDGIYLADKASKSAQYISDSGYSRNGTKGSLMIVEASLGSVCGRDERQRWGRYDTVFAGTKHGVLNNEWCVHNPKAVIPRYLV